MNVEKFSQKTDKIITRFKLEDDRKFDVMTKKEQTEFLKKYL